MRRFTKITVSLPNELLVRLDRAREQRREGRSEATARLLNAALYREQEQADVERYVRGYLEQPETEDELAANDALAIESAPADRWQ